MFGPRQVGEMIVGTAVATETTVDAFITGASDKEIKLLSADGTAPTANKTFYFLQKTNGDVAKNLNFEFSDRIDPKWATKITAARYQDAVLGAYKVDEFGVANTIAAKRTYEIAIKVESYLSPENFDIITGYYVTGEVLGSDTATTVRDGLLKSLNDKLKLRGNGEFTVVADGTGILITEKYQDNTPGKNDGRKLLFSVSAAVYDNVSNGYNGNLQLLTVTQTVKPFVGVGTGKWATEYEYFVSGYKYDPNRMFAYPVNFDTPYYTSKGGKYHVIQIIYYTPRFETSQENQFKVLTIAVDAGVAGTTFTEVNKVLADLRTVFTGTGVTVPANLAAPTP